MDYPRVAKVVPKTGQGLQKDTKMEPKGTKMEPRGLPNWGFRLKNVFKKRREFCPFRWWFDNIAKRVSMLNPCPWIFSTQHGFSQTAYKVLRSSVYTYILYGPLTCGNLIRWSLVETDESMNPWIKESVNQWIDESMNQWITESMNRWITESTNRWITESPNRWINESVNRWIHESRHGGGVARRAVGYIYIYIYIYGRVPVNWSPRESIWRDLLSGSPRAWRLGMTTGYDDWVWRQGMTTNAHLVRILHQRGVTTGYDDWVWRLYDHRVWRLGMTTGYDD